MESSHSVLLRAIEHLIEDLIELSPLVVLFHTERWDKHCASPAC